MIGLWIAFGVVLLLIVFMYSINGKGDAARNGRII